MVKIKNRLRMAFDSRPENVGLARVAVAALASQLDFTVSELDDIKGAVSEAVSNAIIHGYRERSGETVRLDAILTEHGLEVMVEDEGEGIQDVTQAQVPGFTSTPERLGLGFAFMESFMDTVEVISAPGQGTRVRLTKRIERGEHARAH
ncbi:MAG: anti-sigma F factor [Thermoanaerobacterales bacterium]|nr:anti-sigma F factor [Thermoanaerobacterales bacterium]